MTKEPPVVSHDRAEEASERRSYCIGVGFALVLTLTAFAVPWLRLLSGMQGIVLLGVLALVQIVVHLRYFMHIDLEKSHRDDLLLILFTALIITIIVGGTLWILSNQQILMMGR